MKTIAIEVIEYHNEKRWHAMEWPGGDRPVRRENVDLHTLRGKTAIAHVFSIDWPLSRKEAIVVAAAVLTGKCRVEQVDLRR